MTCGATAIPIPFYLSYALDQLIAQPFRTVDPLDALSKLIVRDILNRAFAYQNPIYLY